MRQIELVLIAIMLGSAGDSAFAQNYIFGRTGRTIGIQPGVGTAPLAVAQGDFNGDGKTDFAVANSGSKTVSVILASATGYAPHKNYPVGRSPLAIAAGDFNRDGHLDLVVANTNDATISVLLNTGKNGTFKTQVTYPTGSTPGALVLADFNRDGKLDIAVNLPGSEQVAVLLGNGDGTFKSSVYSPTGSFAGFIGAADFNHDGIPDLIISGHVIDASGIYDVISVLLGNGDGTFQTHMDYRPLSAAEQAVVADFNGDGIPDFAATSSCDASQTTLCVAVWTGNGDGTLRSPLYAPINRDYLGGTNTPSRLIATDLNHDGRMDLVCLGAGSVLLGNGDGTFQPQIQFPEAAIMFAGVSGDYKGDNVTDLAAVSLLGTLEIFLGDGTGNFSIPSTPLSTSGWPQQTPTAALLADFTGDTKPDLAVLLRGAVGSLLVAAGNGDGTFQPPVITTVSNAQSMVAADFNRDGKMDVAIAGATSVWVLLGNGNGTFQPARSYAVGNVGLASRFGIATTDLNGDGVLDLVVANQGDNTVSVLLGAGDGSFGPQHVYATAAGPATVVVGDFNGDGKPDLAVAAHGPGKGSNGTNLVSLLAGNGDGTFGAHVDTSTGARTLLSIAAADFNGDGKLDVATVSVDIFSGSSVVAVLLGIGDGTFKRSANTALSSGGDLIATDLNGDGKTDLATLEEWGVGLLLGEGNGTFAALSIPVFGLIVAGDLNGDGRTDLVVISGVGGVPTGVVYLNLPR